MYVCLSVTGLRLKYTSLRIVYVPSGTYPSCTLELTIRWSDDARPENASRGTKDV